MMSGVENWVKSALDGEIRGQQKPVTTRISAQHLERLDQIAAAVNRSRSNCAEALLEQAIDDAWNIVRPRISEPAVPPIASRSTEATEMPVHARVNGGIMLNFDELMQLDSVTDSKPARVEFPDGSVMQVRDWKDVDLEVARWIGEHLELPVPFSVGVRGNNLFLASSARHADGRPMDPLGQVHLMRLRGRDVHVFTKIGSNQHVKTLHRLIHASGGEPRDFRVLFAVPPKALQ